MLQASAFEWEWPDDLETDDGVIEVKHQCQTNRLIQNVDEETDEQQDHQNSGFVGGQKRHNEDFHCQLREYEYKKAKTQHRSPKLDMRPTVLQQNSNQISVQKSAPVLNVSKTLVAQVVPESERMLHPSKVMLTPSLVKAACPFEIEDDSEDETVVASSTQPQSLKNLSLEAEEDRVQRAAQRAESQRLRHEAIRKKNGITPSEPKSIHPTSMSEVQYEPIIITDKNNDDYNENTDESLESIVFQSQPSLVNSEAKLYQKPGGEEPLLTTTEGVRNQQIVDQQAFEPKKDDVASEARFAESSLLTRARPSGPFSLNRRAGQTALSQHSGCEPSTVPKNGLPSSVSRERVFSQERKSHERHLREICSEDVKLLRWRDGGISWDEIVKLFEEATGLSRARKTLVNRYGQIKRVLTKTDVNADLLDRVAAGDVSAKVNLIKAVQDRSLNINVLQTDTGPSTRKDDFLELSATLQPSPQLGAPFHESRSKTAGKVMNEEAFHHYLSALAEEYAKETRVVVGEKFDEEAIAEEDYCHFYYVVQRRELSSYELDKEIEISSKPFVDCNDRHYDKPHRANAAAASEAFLAHDPALTNAMANTQTLSVNREQDENGLHLFTVDCGAEGMVQVRVDRRLRSAHERKRPQSTDGWLQRTVYYIKERKITRIRKKAESGEEKAGMFGESADVVDESAQERHIDNAAYTALELANDVAIRYVVKLAFRSSSPNLRQRDQEQLEMKETFRIQLEEQGQGAFFNTRLEEEQIDKGKMVEVIVFVEKGKLVGPRNL